MKLRRYKHRLNEAIRAGLRLGGWPSTRARRLRYLRAFHRMVAAGRRFGRPRPFKPDACPMARPEVYHVLRGFARECAAIDRREREGGGQPC